jgi:hypothetical protein
MSAFWADFKEIDGRSFRFDTRIYLNAVASTDIQDICIGAVVGKNPGSAKAGNAQAGLQPITLDGDKLLPTVRNILVKAYEQAQLPVPARSYIQVLNLFYLCQPNFKQAIAAMAHKPAARVCPSEAGYFPWLWYVWGGPAVALDSYKERYQTIRSGCHFYFDKNNGRIVAERATKQVFARHTQGLKHDLLVPFLAGLIGPDQQSSRHLVRP